MEVDFFQILIKVGLVAGISQFLSKYFETATRNQELEKYLKYSWIGATILYGLTTLFSVAESDKVFYYLLFAFIIFCTYELNDPKTSRTVLISTLPLFFISFISDFLETIFPKFHQTQLDKIGTLSGFATFWLIAFSIYSFRQTKKDRLQHQKEIEEHERLLAQKNTLEYQVSERTLELTEQKNALENSLTELRSTQNQLIQAEKMASLGELTAGIAHEIQNPLNFVNNFSEVSTELCQELKELIHNETYDKKYAEEILNDLVQNQEKITHHGKRASSIVKGMLMHSRTSSGQKELIDINELADEYLRLSYHGLRAKDQRNANNKPFNADFKTHFDPNLPKISIIPQDFGRVLLNLTNNAFYAVSKRDDNKGLVEVSTAKMLNSVEIRIKDNGIGIDEITQSKIFQPFFTTKPTGEGTGLGLSLAYEIITKGHGGTIECVSKVGEGTEFIISIPIL
jgi:two-component system, NtrC family, sensor kinase